MQTSDIGNLNKELLTASGDWTISVPLTRKKRTSINTTSKNPILE